jgi:hypothetical protein
MRIIGKMRRERTLETRVPKSILPAIFVHSWFCCPKRKGALLTQHAVVSLFDEHYAGTSSSRRVLCQLFLKEHQLVGVADGIQVLDMMVRDIDHRYKIQA